MKIADFIRSQPTKSFAKDEILIYQDTVPRHLFAIRSGFVKVHDVAEDGSEQLNWLAKKYDVLPVEWLFDTESKSQFFYTAHTDVEAFIVSREAFMAHAKDDPETLLAITETIIQQYHDLLRHVNAAQKPKARDKVTYSLFFLSKRFLPEKNEGLQKITIPLNHRDIAGLVGTSRETVSLELKKLKDEGVIDYDKTAFYIDYEKLAERVI